jgi:hypothetical protein
VVIRFVVGFSFGIYVIDNGSCVLHYDLSVYLWDRTGRVIDEQARTLYHGGMFALSSRS